VIFSPRSNVFEAHIQKPSTLQKVKIAMEILVQNLEKKFTIIHSQNWIFGAKI